MVELDIAPEETEEERLEREAKVRDWRSRAALRAAPELAQHVRAIAIGGQVEAGETIREYTAPMRITAADDVDEFFTQLIGFRTYWQRQSPTTEAPPRFNDTWRNAQQEVLGFEAGTTPELAAVLVRFQTRQLLDIADSIALHPVGATYQDAVTQLVWAFRARYPIRDRGERTVMPRPCPVCGQEGVGADWFVAGDPASVRVECALCGHRIPVTKLTSGATNEWLPTVETITDRMVVSEARRDLLAQPLLRASEAAYLVGKSTRQIQRWMRDGSLPTYKHPWKKDRHVKLAEVRHRIETEPTRQR